MSASQTSDPYRPYLSETLIYTTSFSDSLGRVIKVRTPDSAIVRTSFSGNTVTVQDQMGKQRKSVSDALGRLVQVYEAPNDPAYNYLTSYEYDALDDLTKVTQDTQPPREFTYGSVKRLTSAKNPESGMICYGTVSNGQCHANGYDANGNLVYKTDARGVLSSYGYDALNRNTNVTYTNDPSGTPSVTRAYDNPANGANGKGRLWSTQTSGSTQVTIDSYDALGRPKNQRQQFYYNNAWSQSYSVSNITYDLAGHVKTMNYPSNHSVAYNYHAAGRLNSFTGNLGDGGAARTYSSGIIYSPFGGMTKEQFGTTTAIFNKLFYNSRGQLAEIREGTSYTGPNDIGWERGAIINHYSDQCLGMCGGSNSTTAMTDNNGNLKMQQHVIQDGNGKHHGALSTAVRLRQSESFAERLR